MLISSVGHPFTNTDILPEHTHASTPSTSPRIQTVVVSNPKSSIPPNHTPFRNQLLKLDILSRFSSHNPLSHSPPPLHQQVVYL
ncbi:hypothetical protein QL285_097954 [Trifolium repens]|nr:hypothetical protein QL285_097954 [Trifolium repens]